MLYSLHVLRKEQAREPIALLVLTVSSSGLVYTMAYLLIGVSSQFRYVYWLYLSAMLAGTLTVGLIAGRSKHSRVAVMNSAEQATQEISIAPRPVASDKA
jgi:hypothetical protein